MTYLPTVHNGILFSSIIGSQLCNNLEQYSKYFYNKVNGKLHPSSSRRYLNTVLGLAHSINTAHL